VWIVPALIAVVRNGRYVCCLFLQVQTNWLGAWSQWVDRQLGLDLGGAGAAEQLALDGGGAMVESEEAEDPLEWNGARQCSLLAIRRCHLIHVLMCMLETTNTATFEAQSAAPSSGCSHPFLLPHVSFVPFVLNLFPT
jgi:hypothetical protein